MMFLSHFCIKKETVILVNLNIYTLRCLSAFVCQAEPMSGDEGDDAGRAV